MPDDPDGRCRLLDSRDSLRGLRSAGTLTAGIAAIESVESAESPRTHEGQMAPDASEFPIWSVTCPHFSHISTPNGGRL